MLVDELKNFTELELFVKKYNSLHRSFELMQDVLSEKELKRFNECGTFLKYAVFKDNSNYNFYLIQANFCKNRWCSLCNWRRRLKYFNINKNRLLQIKQKNKNVKFIFLTLTIKNTYYKDLKKDLNLILKGFRKLFKYKRIADNPAILGYLRSLEFTLQKDNFEYVNLHIHTLIAVKTSYFNKSYNYYINKQEWTELWKRATGVNYTPIVDIRLVKNRRTKKKLKVKRAFNEEGAVMEISKYLVKDFDLFELQKAKRADIFKEIYQAFKNVRVIGYGGIFAPKNLKSDEKNEEEDLIKVSDEQVQGQKVAEAVYELGSCEDGVFSLKNYDIVQTETV